MKIAILTQPLWTNYGGILQAYALQTILQHRGHKVIVINRDYHWDTRNQIKLKILFARILSFVKTAIRIYIFKHEGYILTNPFSPYYHTKRSETDSLPFVRKFIRLSPKIRTSHALNKYCKRHRFDAYIVGSDQVWRPCYSPCLTDFFLKEVPSNRDAIKISYAASFGTDIWEFSPEETKECSELLKKFNAVSVREQSGVKLCGDNLGVDALHLLDPTLLLNTEDYLKLIEKTSSDESAGNLFCYILDYNTEAEKIIDTMKKDGYTPFYAGLDPQKYNISVEQWLKSFYNAQIILTDSFHACVFSILFKKPFVVIGNENRGVSRLHSLLSVFGLTTNLVYSYDDYMKQRRAILNTYDNVEIEAVLTKWRTKSDFFFSSVGL